MAAPIDRAGGARTPDRLDRGLLAAYCQAHALWVEAVSLARYGTMVKSPNGFRCRAPTSRSRTSLGRAHGEDRIEFGMTPSSRTRIRLGEGPAGRLRDFPASPWLRSTRVPGNRVRGLWPRSRSSPTAWSGVPASVISRTFPRARAALRSSGSAARDRILRLSAPSKGEWAGQTFDLAPWQAFVVGCLFGWQRSDGLRRFRTAYCAVPRKNGKSTLSAGIGLYLLVADGEQGAEVYSAATSRDQARIVFDEAKRMVGSSRRSGAGSAS